MGRTMDKAELFCLKKLVCPQAPSLFSLVRKICYSKNVKSNHLYALNKSEKNTIGWRKREGNHEQSSLGSTSGVVEAHVV